MSDIIGPFVGTPGGGYLAAPGGGWVAASITPPPTLVGATPTALQQILGSYVYQQYADDDAIQAFALSYNAMAQAYLDWFNTINLPVWTSPLLVGPLLDWVAQGLYGISRPLIPSVVTNTTGPINTMVLNTSPLNAWTVTESGTYQAATDDIYKRVLTWQLYRGDGPQMTLSWLKRRITRFLSGVGGVDSGVSSTYTVSVSVASGVVTIGLPAGSVSNTLKSLISAGDVNLPFQYSYTVTVA